MSQLDLIPADESAVVEACAGRPRCTGSTVLRDQELASQIAELLALGRGCRTIARVTGLDKRTVRACRNALTQSGKLPPLKERFLKLGGEIILDGMDGIHESILDGSLKGSQLSVAVGIIADKMPAWAGEANTVIEHRSVRAEVTIDDLRRMKREAAGLVADVESGGKRLIAGVSGGCPVLDTGLDTGGLSVIEVSEVGPAAGGAEAGAVKGGGGGVPLAGGGQRDAGIAPSSTGDKGERAGEAAGKSGGRLEADAASGEKNRATPAQEAARAMPENNAADTKESEGNPC